MPAWLDNLYARKKSKYRGVREQYRICKKAIKVQRVAYNELERSMIAYHRAQAESISKIDDAPDINTKLTKAYERVQKAKAAHDIAMETLHTSLPELFSRGNDWIMDGMKTLKTELNIPMTHLASAFGIVPDLLMRWLKRQKDK
jgi:shikimate 5-dehydrogenase